MPTNVHSKLPAEEIHRPFRQIFADLSALAADSTTYTSDDLYKMGYVQSNEKLYVLTSISPIAWSEVSGGGGSTSIKLAKIIYVDPATPDVIPGTTTTDTAFSSQINIPAGSIAEGDMVSLGLIIQIDGGASLTPSPEITSTFTCKLEVGTTSGDFSAEIFQKNIDTGQSSPIFFGIGGTTGGFINVSSNNALALIGSLQWSGVLELKGCSVFPISDFSEVTSLKILFSWDGLTADAQASLTLLQVQIVAEA